MTTSPVVSVTDELIAELESVAHSNDADCMEVHGISVGIVRSLLAERAELKRDAERYIAALNYIIAHVDGNIRPTVRDCVNGMNYVQDIYDYCDQIEAAIDAAMQS